MQLNTYKNVGLLKKDVNKIYVIDEKKEFEIIDSSYCKEDKKLHLVFKIKGYDGVIANFFRTDTAEYQILLDRLSNADDGAMCWFFENDFIGLRGKANIYFYENQPCIEPITIERIPNDTCEDESEYEDEYEDEEESDFAQDPMRIFYQEPLYDIKMLTIEEVMQKKKK